MAKLFRRHRPESSLEWTGERLVSGVNGRIESEHLHRYFLARELCGGLRVLDVASGEGYGTALLAQTAQSATGIELDEGSVEHSSRWYQRPNLKYLRGEATRLPVESGSFDVVVSFETLEHLAEQELILAEIRRVLCGHGFLIISTPDADIYSGAGAAPNPFHVRELSRPEFADLLAGSFSHVRMFRQRAFAGSLILPDSMQGTPCPSRVYEQRDSDTFEEHTHLPRAPYLLAIASNVPAPLPGFSAYIQSDDEEKAERAATRSELERLRKVEAAASEQAPAIQEQLARGAAAIEENARLSQRLLTLEADIELLRKTEEAYRTQEPIIQSELAEAAHLREELRMLREQLASSTLHSRQQTLSINRLQKELEARIQSEISLRRQIENAGKDLTEAKEKDHLQDESSGEPTALGAAELRKKLQAQRDLYDQAATALVSSRAEAARNAQLVKELAGLIVPVWMRKLIPQSLRPVARAIREAVVSH